jgi:putative ABC transport system substrate-binding protein
VDLLFAFPTGPAIEAKSATKETKIPVIFCFSTIEDTGLVESVRHPGGNITGIRYPGPDLVVKRFEILREIEPKLRRLWLLYNPDYPAVKTSIEALRPAARSAGVALIETYIKNVDDIRAAVAAREKLADIGIDAILILPEIISQSFEGWKVINDFASEHKLAIGGNAGEQADRGALFSYMPDNIENGRLAASLADKILKGTPAGTIPVITPESRLRLNYRKIKELGLKVSEGLLSQASDIIR